MDFLFVPTVLFLTIVAPIWIIMHYVFKGKSSKGISEDERAQLEQMLALFDKLDERIHTLEEILEAEHPEWRTANRRRSDKE